MIKEWKYHKMNKGLERLEKERLENKDVTYSDIFSWLYSDKNKNEPKEKK